MGNNRSRILPTLLHQLALAAPSFGEHIRGEPGCYPECTEQAAMGRRYKLTIVHAAHLFVIDSTVVCSAYICMGEQLQHRAVATQHLSVDVRCVGPMDESHQGKRTVKRCDCKCA